MVLLDVAFRYVGLMEAAATGDKKAALEAVRLKIVAENGDIEMNYRILQTLRRIRDQMNKRHQRRIMKRDKITQPSRKIHRLWRNTQRIKLEGISWH